MTNLLDNAEMFFSHQLWPPPSLKKNMWKGDQLMMCPIALNIVILAWYSFWIFVLRTDLISLISDILRFRTIEIPISPPTKKG